MKEIKERFASPYCAETPWETLTESYMEEIQSKYHREKKAGLLDKHGAQAYLATIQTCLLYTSFPAGTFGRSVPWLLPGLSL